MPNLLKGKTAVITGGGGGIGKEISLAMAREGVKVVVNDLGASADGSAGIGRGAADEVVDEIKKAGGTAIPNYDSVADFAATENIVNTCVDNFGRIDILVNCAGIGAGAVPIWEMSEKDWDVMMAINLKGTFNTCRHAMAHMVKQKMGRIINFASTAWLVGSGSIAYSASKGGVVSFTKAIATHLACEDYRITCNTIVPIAGPMGSRYRDVSSERQGQLAKLEQLNKAGLLTQQIYEEICDRPGPEHISAIVLYLATDEAAHISGREFGASRGRVALYSEPEEIKGLYKEGVWTLDELVKRIPVTLTQDI